MISAYFVKHEVPEGEVIQQVYKEGTGPRIYRHNSARRTSHKTVVLNVII